MKKFIAFVKKEFYHIFRDKRTMIILFGLPVVQILLFGFVISTEIENIEIAVLDKSGDNTTREIVNKILGSKYFKLSEYIYSDEDVEKVFRGGNVRQVVIFEENFEKKLKTLKHAKVQIITDASDPNMANLTVNYTSGIIYDYVSKRNVNLKIPMAIKTSVRMMYNPSIRSVYMFVPGTMAMILMLVSALITSIAITREKELGTMEVLLVSPLKVRQIIIGKVTPYVVLSFVNVVSILLLSVWVFEMPINGSVTLLILVSMLFIFMALSLGILISTVTSSQQIAMMISLLALMLPTILLSGFIFPIENMPEILQWLSVIMPPKYFINIVKDIMLKGVGIEYVWKDVSILAGMTMFFLVVSTKKFKVRLE